MLRKGLIGILIVSLCFFDVGMLAYSAQGDYGTIGQDRSQAVGSRDVLRVDSNGDLIPGVDGTRDIGTSSLEWQDGYFDGTLYVDTLEAQVATNIVGATDISGNLTQDGVLRQEHGTQTVVAASSNTAITLTDRIMEINCNVTAITSGATPLISTQTWSNGTIVTLVASSNTFTIQDNDTLSNSCVELLDGTTVALAQYDTITLKLDDGKWYQQGSVNHIDGSWNRVGNVTVAGNLTGNGTTNAIGNAATDQLTVTGDFRHSSYVTLTASATVTVSSGTYIYCNTASGLTVTLPDPATCAGRSFFIKTIGATGTQITVDGGNGSDIDGDDPNTQMDAQYDWMVVHSTGGIHWYIIGEKEH